MLNFCKQRIKVAKLHEKISNTRMDNLHKISSQIVKENQFIFSEDLNIKGMVKNSNLSKSIHDASWSELTRQLQYKSKWNGRTYHKIDRFYASSQTCNKCNYKNENIKNLSIREWTCPKCGTYHNRVICLIIFYLIGIRSILLIQYINHSLYIKHTDNEYACFFI